MKHGSILLATIIAVLSACVQSRPTIAPTRIDVLEAANQTLAAQGANANTPEYTRAPAEPILPATASKSNPIPTDTANPKTSREPSPQAAPASCISPDAQTQIGTVIDIISGDSIEVAIDGRKYKVRYIGIDTPNIKQSNEPVEYLAPEARSMNASLVENQTVTLVKDISESDKYDRLLRYAFVPDLNGVFVNYELVRQGFAASVTFRPDVACAGIFNQAEGSAKQEKLGLWAPVMPTQVNRITREGSADSGGIQITDIFYNGVAGDNEPDEFVEIRNDGAEGVQLQGWTLSDKARHTFTFPNFILQPSQTCRVYTDEIHPDTCGFSFEFRETAIWNNGGDCAYLEDGAGNLIAETCY